MVTLRFQKVLFEGGYGETLDVSIRDAFQLYDALRASGSSLTQNEANELFIQYQRDGRVLYWYVLDIDWTNLKLFLTETRLIANETKLKPNRFKGIGY